ncbi:MAG: hypothetical protein ACO1SV_06050 [Fimbriimonas sp.]
METRLRRGARIGAAALLATVTLGVFYVLQDYGPESAIRRFHRAVQARDSGELARVTEQPIDSPEVQELIRWVDQTSRFGARYQLLRVERQRREVYAALDYTAPNGENYATVWVVEKKGETWKVDAVRTVTILRDGFLGGVR